MGGNGNKSQNVTAVSLSLFSAWLAIKEKQKRVEVKMIVEGGTYQPGDDDDENASGGKSTSWEQRWLFSSFFKKGGGI